MPKELRCALSEKTCDECEKMAECIMHSERYVLRKDLKNLKKRLEDTQLIVNAILKR